MAETAKQVIEVQGPDGAAARVPVTRAQLIIGRAEDADVQLDHATVSRRHAELSRDPFGRWWLRDLGSRNGTFLNGQSIREAVMTSGDIVQIEQFMLRLRDGDESTGDSREAPAAAALTQSGFTVTDGVTGPVRRLAELAAPKIEASHLAALIEFGKALLLTDPAAERLAKLCELMVGERFKGRSAMALRLPRKGRPVKPPELLCEPKREARDYSKDDPYVSRTLLNAVRDSEQAVVASNTDARDAGPEAVELSIAADVMMLAAAAVPLTLSAEMIDVLYVNFPAAYGTPEWSALMELACEQYALAQSIWAERRKGEQQAVIENELRRAKRIQMALVPQRVEIDGLDIAIGFEPCRWVGGDYADVLPVGDGRVFVIIADVCGKGLQAAMVTASLHTLVHTHVKSGVVLREMGERFNDYLSRSLPEESFVTMILLTIEPATGRMQCVNCGHPPAAVVTASGESRQMQSSANPPAGCMWPLELEAQEDQLRPDEVVVMYTDGLSEMRGDNGGMLGMAGVERLFGGIRAQAENACCDALLHELEARLSEHQADLLAQDDRCFILLRRA